jgi:PAS domain-containing protein
MQAALDAERARADALERALDEARSQARGGARAAAEAPRAQAAQADADGDTALVPRAALELLKLKVREEGARVEGVERVGAARRRRPFLPLPQDAAMDATLEGITIADARVEDSPLIYVNRAFARITGYSVAETIGKNCRFLQGPGTDQATVARLRAAVRAGRPAAVQLVRKKGGAGTRRV